MFHDKSTNKVQHDASEDTVHSEADAALHTHHAGKTVILEYCLLDSAYFLRSIVTKDHVVLPIAICRRKIVYLWSVLHDDCQIMIAVHVCGK